MADSPRAEVIALAKMGGHAQAIWTKAAKTGLGHALLVAKNNPKSSLLQISQRPDVQAALAHSTIKAAQDAQDAIKNAWVNAGGDLDSPYLANLLADSLKNAHTFGSQANSAFLSGNHKALQGLVAKFGLRIAAGQGVAITRARNEALFKEFSDAGVTHVRWKTTSGDPCPVCVALEGTVVPLGASFPVGASLGVYGDLTMPPRHPNCQCVIEDAS